MRKPAGTVDRQIGWLTERADYLALGAKTDPSIKKWITPYFVLQVRVQTGTPHAYRVGFTASRKVGNAVLRNRVRRRLRELVRLNLPQLMQPGHDLVLIARTPAATAPFDQLRDTLGWAIKKLGIAA